MRRSSATRRSRSPITTASTARSSSRTPPSSSAIRPITGAEVTLSGVGSTEPPGSGGAGFAGAGAGGGGAHVTLLCESGKGYANLCRILTAAHAGTRPEGKEDRVLLPPAVPLETVAELSEGLVCLSGCARDGLALHDRPAPRGSPPRSAGSGSSSSCSVRTSGATRDATRSSATSPSTSAWRRSPRGTSMPTPRGGRCSRTCSSRSAAAPRSTGASASGAGTARRCCAPRPRWSSASPGSTVPRPSAR